MSAEALTEIENLHVLALRVGEGFEKAGIRYQAVGSFAVFLQVELVDWAAARLTGVVDLIVESGVEHVNGALAVFGMRSRSSTHGWLDIVDVVAPKSYSRIRFRFGEFSTAIRVHPGVMVMPVPELVRLNLQIFRLKDQLHVQDLDAVGLITPEIEATLSEPLRARLASVRATE